MSELKSVIIPVRSNPVRRALRFFVAGSALLCLTVILVAQIPPSRPGAWSEARAEFVVELPHADVWRRLQNLRLAHHYVPGVNGVEILSDSDRGVGASRRVFQEGGGSLDETVVEWAEERGFVIRLHRGEEGPPAPFERARFRYWIEEGGTERCRLSLTIFYQPLGGRAGEWLDGGLLNSEMNRRMEDLAGSMKRYYEMNDSVR